jgi:hypothetical protein
VFKVALFRLRSAGFQTCCIADFQIGKRFDVVRSAGLETGDTADLEVRATLKHIRLGSTAVPNFKNPWRGLKLELGFPFFNTL